MVAIAGITPDGFRWKLAPCLVVLVRELKERHPTRSTRSDGSIASAAHSKQNPTSDHEADRRDGLVKALDLTDDPPRFDPDDFADLLIRRRDPRIKYIIKDGQIWRSYKDHAGHPPIWVPQKYTGPNSHSSHAHISVLSARAGDTSSWFGSSVPTTPPPPVKPQEDDIVFTVAEAADYVKDGYTHIVKRPPTGEELYLWAHAIAKDPREMWKMQQRLVGEAIRAS